MEPKVGELYVYTGDGTARGACFKVKTVCRRTETFTTVIKGQTVTFAWHFMLDCVGFYTKAEAAKFADELRGYRT